MNNNVDFIVNIIIITIGLWLFEHEASLGETPHIIFYPSSVAL